MESHGERSSVLVAASLAIASLIGSHIPAVSAGAAPVPVPAQRPLVKPLDWLKAQTAPPSPPIPRSRR